MSSRMADYEREGGWVPPRSAAGIHWPKRPIGGAATDWRAAAHDFITGNPGLALGVALALGVTLGWLIKRR